MHDPGEHSQLAGIHCAACGGRYDLIRILGRYGRSYKLLVRCPSCKTYGIGTAQMVGHQKSLDKAPGAVARTTDAPMAQGDSRPVSEQDVSAMREFLTTFDGDFRALWASE